LRKGEMTYESVLAFSQTWGLVYFMAVFFAVLVYALRPSARRKFEEAANIPLKED